MIAFKDIEPGDRQQITRYTPDSAEQGCDLSFSNLCSWRFLYNTRYAVLEDCLLLKFRLDEKPVYMKPIGGGDVYKALEALAEDAHADYLYLRTDLAGLSGKKFQAKRNHVNKFKRMYTYEYLPITPARVAECAFLEAEWCKANNCAGHEGTGNERHALLYALEHFEELGLCHDKP